MRQNNTYIKEVFYPHITEFPMYKAKNNFSVTKQIAEQVIKILTDACVENGNMLNFDLSDTFWLSIKSNGSGQVPEKVAGILSENQKQILQLVKQNNTISMSQMAKEIGISKRKILDNMNKLKAYNLIKRIGPAQGGYWKIIM